MTSLRARVPAALSLLVAAALVVTTPTSYADETATSEPTATADPTPTATPAAEPADPTPTAEPTDPGVRFPETRRIAPDSGAYVVDVDAPGYAFVRVSTLGWSERAAPVGPVEVTFPYDGEWQVEVTACRAEYDCHTIATGPVVSVHRSLGIELPVTIDQTVSPSRPEVVLTSAWDRAMDGGTVTWRLLDAEGGQVAGGTETYSRMTGYVGGATFPLRLPATLPDGQRRLEIEAVADIEGFGELRSTSSGPVRWDTVVKARIDLPHHEIYPFEDNHRDHLRVELVPGEELGGGSVDVLDASGAVVRTLYTADDLVTGYRFARWDGTDASGAPVAPGEYLVRATLRDRWGNERVTTESVHLGAERLHTVRWSQTFRAADTVIDTAVGRCSDYDTPSSRGDRGSFRLASQTRCRTAPQSHAIALSGVFLPPSVGARYTDLGVTMKGGPSRGARDAYAVFGILRKDRTLAQRSVLRGPYGTDTLTLPKPGTSVRTDESGRPYVLWQAGLSEGSRWDVESYTVRARIAVLR